MWYGIKNKKTGKIEMVLDSDHRMTVKEFMYHDVPFPFGARNYKVVEVKVKEIKCQR